MTLLPRIIMALAGLWMMVAPHFLRYEKKIADNAHIVGPLILTFSIISFWECTRNVRWANLPIAGWLLIAPWIMQYDHTAATINDYAVALIIFIFVRIKATTENRFGGGWPAVWRSYTLHSRSSGNIIPRDRSL